MKVDVRHAGAIPILSPAGRVTIGPPSRALKDALEAAIAAGASHIIVDASRVAYLDSSGIGELIAAARQLSESGGQLGISSPTPKVREIMEITGLQALFIVGENDETVAAAIASAKPPTGGEATRSGKP